MPTQINLKPETRNSKPILSRDNSLLRRARAVRDGKVTDLIFVEGLRLCEEALTSNLKIEATIYSDQLARKDRAAKLIDQLGERAVSSASVSEKLLESISYTKTPQGIVVLAERPAGDLEHFDEQQPAKPLIVVLHETNNPVNVGAIVRTAEAAGASGVITTANTADPFSPKALRGAMGSAFRLPIWTKATFGELIAWCKARSIRTVAATLTASTHYQKLDWRGPTALIVGSESSGLAQQESLTTDVNIKIPMHGRVESLNVAAAAAVVLFEAATQRARQAAIRT